MRRVKTHSWKTQLESWEDMNEAGRFNPSLELVFKDKAGKHTVKIGSGRSDYLDLYRDGKHTYLLSRNYGLDYVSLDIFEGNNHLGDVFVESHQMKDYGVNVDMAPYNIIKRLAEYI